MELLESVDDERLERKSSIDQFKEALVIIRGGRFVPISFDVIDYIDCKKVVSHKAIIAPNDYFYPVGTKCYKKATVVTSDDPVVRDRGLYTEGDNGELGLVSCGQLRIGLSYVKAKDSIDGEEDGQTDTLYSVDDNRVKRHSSIDQYKNNFLYIVRGGRAVPIRFDIVDYIKCEKGHKLHPVSHGAILSDGNDIGFNFPVGHRRFVSDVYVQSDLRGTYIRELPAYYGEGFYEEYIDATPIITGDISSLGVRNCTDLHLGLSYVLADETIQGED